MPLTGKPSTSNSIKYLKALSQRGILLAINSKNNFDKLTLLIDAFLKKNRTSINQIGSLYVNRGPGSFAGIRTSLSIVKGIHFTKKIDYFSFSYSDFVNEDQKKIERFKHEEEMSQYRFYAVIGAGLSLMVCLIAIFLYRQNKIKQKSNWSRSTSKRNYVIELLQDRFRFN